LYSWIGTGIPAENLQNMGMGNRVCVCLEIVLLEVVCWQNYAVSKERDFNGNAAH